MSKLIETLTRPSGFGPYLPTLLALGFGLSGGGLLLLSRFGDNPSVVQRVIVAILTIVLIGLCCGCIWLIERILRHLRLANRELESCCDIYTGFPAASIPLAPQQIKSSDSAPSDCGPREASPSTCKPSGLSSKREESDASTYYTLTIQDLYNNAPCGYHSIDSNGRVVLMNDTELRMLGYDRDKVVGIKLFFEFVAPESVGLWMDQFEVLKIQGWVNNLEINLVHRDGRRFPVLVNSTAVWDQDGNYKMSRSTVVDVSQHKRTEHALRQSEAQYRGIVEDQTELICRFLPDGQLTFVNQAYCRYFGVRAEDLIGRTFTPSIPEEDRAYVQDQFLQLCLEQPMVHYEHRVILPNGEMRWQAWTDRAMFDEYGVLVEYQGVGRDISEQYLHAAAVNKLSKALEMAVVGIAEVSPDGHYVQVNAAYGEMCGYDPSDLIGEEWWSLISRKDRPAALSAYQAMMDDDRAEVEVRSVRKQGDRFHQKIVLVKAYDQQNQFVGHYCFTQDISTRHELDRLKDEFVSIVSHELRTPLTSIAGALDLLASGVLQAQPAQSQRMILIAAQNTERLVRMINDILDVERIKAGKVPMNYEHCALSDIFGQSIDVMQTMADQNEVMLNMEPTDSVVSVDRDRIIQVMTNLLSNAIKFSGPQTQINIQAEYLDPCFPTHPASMSLDSPAILVSIQDQGRGIPEASLTTIFEPFQQVDASDSRQKGGTGLGLAICRSILQQHNAPFWVESQLDQGSTFFFMLPAFLDSCTREA